MKGLVSGFLSRGFHAILHCLQVVLKLLLVACLESEVAISRTESSLEDITQSQATSTGSALDHEQIRQENSRLIPRNEQLDNSDAESGHSGCAAAGSFYEGSEAEGSEADSHLWSDLDTEEDEELFEENWSDDDDDDASALAALGSGISGVSTKVMDPIARPLDSSLLEPMDAAPNPAANKTKATWSIGSALHGSGDCRPCLWHTATSGCLNGEACNFCHVCKKIRRRQLAPSKDSSQRKSSTELSDN